MKKQTEISVYVVSMIVKAALLAAAWAGKSRSRTYFQKIGSAEDIAPIMAVGFTINHIVAIVIPIAGGWLWMIDYRIPFITGAGLSLVSLLLTQLIRLPSTVPDQQ